MNYWKLGLLLILFYSCNKEGEEENCPIVEDIGIVKLTEESQRFVPSEYSDSSETFEFISQNGELKTFRSRSFQAFEFGPIGIKEACENDLTDSTRIWFEYDWISHSLMSEDSLSIGIVQAVNFTRFSLYDIISLSLYDVKKSLSLSRSYIITDPRKNEISTIENPLGNIYYNELEIAGSNFQDVWGDDGDWSEANIFFKKDFGCVGFIDENGIEWKLNI